MHSDTNKKFPDLWLFSNEPEETTSTPKLWMNLQATWDLE